MKFPEPPSDWSAHQAFAVLEFLETLHRTIWNHYEHDLVDLIIQRERASHPRDEAAVSLDHDIPW